MITLWRVFQTGFRNLFRNAWLSVAATAVMVVTLVIVSFFVFSGVFLRKQLAVVRDKIDITVFLDDNAKADDVKALQAKLIDDSNVKSVTYVSKEDALRKLASGDKQSQEVAKTAADIGNPLPASLEIRTRDLNNLASINQIIKSPDYKSAITSATTDDGNQRKKIIENIAKISTAVARVGTIISVAFLIIALLIIFNTIRMAIFTRREEIDIMKLVGATKWFVRGPFIIEGALYGVLGATLAILVIFPLVSAIKPAFVRYFDAGDVVKFLTDRTLIVIAAEYLAGILIGAVSSWLAISRHLKL